MTTATIADLRQQALDRLDRYHRRQEALSRTLLGKGHVVCMPGNLYLKVEAEPDPEHPGRHRVVKVRAMGDPLKASQLSKRDAETVAADVVNGAGERGEAIHLADALERSIAADQRALDMLDAALERQEARHGE